MARWLVLILLLAGFTQAQPGVYRTTFSADERYLTVEVLDDDLAHFEISTTPSHDEPIWTSPMVAKTDYAGPSAVEFPSENEIATPDMRLHIDPASLCVTITDLTRDPELVLTTTCPLLDEEDGTVKGLAFTPEGTSDIYGLGEQFRRRRGTDGNWMGDTRIMPNRYGNSLARFNGGSVGNAQFPIMYALGEGTDNYALFVDHLYQQYWGFAADPFVMQTTNTPLRWYMLTGSDLPDLRADYMELTGKPPVPPKQMFGLWVSEYGYENWAELTSVLDSLQAENFPLDGFVLDLFWFGGVGSDSQMGSLAWDEVNFPAPAEFIADLRADYGLGIMTMEEPYVSTTARGYDEALEQDVLVHECEGCGPVTMNEWWGSGSPIDWSNPEAAAWWHDNRRQHLIDEGVIGHWTDLGEPEDFNESAWYFGFPHDHASIHNIYNLLWSKSIWDSYQRNAVERRPFILSRSGTSGTQRYGAAMWSGDIGANMASLAEHMNAQMHMSLSGIDYFGSDVGGFHRQASDPDLSMDDVYTLWFANSALLDVPLRPHVNNLTNLFHTAPLLIGDVPSNLANTRLRYALSPYLYTLAHRAYRTGEAVYPPLVYYFQDDPTARTIGSQKMIGAQMMMATLTDEDPTSTSVYLPSGGWFNFYTGAYVESAGESLDVASDAILQAPLFVRDGAVIPLMNVDEQTLNTLGQRRDGSTDNTVIFNLYHAAENGAFTLIEDDGETMAYQAGDVRETEVTHEADGDNLSVTVGAATGSYAGAPDERNVEIRLFSPERVVGRVLLNGEELPALTESDEQGWLIDDAGVVTVKSGTFPVETALNFVFEPAATTERPLLLAHYMPWYQTPDVSGYWGWHWTMDHFDPNEVDADGRQQIASQYMPLTGPYDSQDDAILEYQVLLMKLSGIDGVIVDWYGTADFNDYAVLNEATGKLFEYATRAGLKFALCYEDRTLQTMVNQDRLSDSRAAIQQAQDDFNYANGQWLGSDAYVTYQGQPLVFVYGPLYFRQSADWDEIFTGLEPRPALITLDENLSFVALAGYPWPPMSMAGGATLYPTVLESYLERFYRNAQRKDFIVGSAFPGFHDIYEEAKVRSSFGYLDPEDGATLRTTLDMALAQNPDIVQLVTWNDYGEGTTIEPTEEYGYQYLEIIQGARQTLDADFAATTDDLQLPMRLLEARRAYADDAEVNAQLDNVFAAIIVGDFDAARAILDEVE